MPPVPGQSLLHYRLAEKIGEGGMGVVWKARDARLHRDVAIKFLSGEVSSDPGRLARFQREARMLASLQHPNVASIFGFEEAGSEHFLVMELVTGENLAGRLRRGPLPIEDALGIACQLAEGLETAHEKGIIHRDLKPSNVMLTPDGRVKVLDFGLAKAFADENTAAAADVSTLTAATHAGVILGTAAYMAPEQARGGVVDKRADIWAFGVVIYEMLTGERLFAEGSGADTLSAVMRKEIDFARLPSSVPSQLRQLVRRCLERDSKNRLRDIGDARIVLQALIAAPGESGEAVAVDAFAAPSGRRPWLALSAMTLIALIVGLLIGGQIPGIRGLTSAAKPTWRFQKLSFLPGVEWAPELSADGKTVFFVAGDTTRSEIYSVPVGGKKPTSLTPGVDAYHDQPRLSPDGRRLIFASSRDGGGLFLMGVNGESVRKLTDRGADPAWSPDGRHVAYSTDEFFVPYEGIDGGTLGLVDVASGTTRELPSGDGHQPAWSPSGRRIAYWGMPNGGNRELATIAVEGGEPVAVASHPAIDWNPVWSGDGQHLYFLSDRAGTMNLWRVAIDEATGLARGEPESVPLPADEVLYLARAGRRWIYAAYSSRSTIQILEFSTARSIVAGDPRSIFSTTETLREVEISPDGEQLAFTSMRPQEDIYVVSSSGGTPTQLTDDPEFDRYVSWAPDGQRILFSSHRGGKYEQYGIRPDGSGLRALTETQGDPGWSPLLSPSADRMVVSTANATMIFDTRGPSPWKQFARIAPPEGPPGTVFAPTVWSPEEDRLAGFVYRGRQPRRVAVLDLATGIYRTFEPVSRTVAWFPDGRRLLIQWQRRLAVLDLATWRATPVPGSPELAGRVVASRDLRTLVSLVDESQADVWLAEEETTP